ncbi:MAG: HD domain-containing protein [Nitrososphaeria archaeon]
MCIGLEAKVEEIKNLLEKIKDIELKKKTLDLLNLTILNKNYILSQASKKVHHSYLGGLIDHTLSTTKIGLAISEQLEDIYRCKVDIDVVISSCLLHDIFKPFTYEEGDNTVNSPLGLYMEHLILLTIKLTQNGFPFKVIHAVAAHHGDSGPVRPETLEAMIVHLADYVDSKLNGDILRKAKTIYQEEVKTGTEPKDILVALEMFSKRAGKENEAEKKFRELFFNENKN